MKQPDEPDMTDATQTKGATSGQFSNRPAPSRREVWKMFDRIAWRYDLLNHLLSANQDKAWRKRLAALLPDGKGLKALDLASGTGDQLLALYDSGRIKHGVGTDLAEKMLAIGRDKITARGLNDSLELKTGDAQNIPFEDNRFDAVTISFGIRNMTDVSLALREMHRVLKPGGRALILEFSLPTNGFIRWGYLIYFRHILPVLGKMISGDDGAYRYLNETVETFPYGQAFCDLMTDAGFQNVKDNRLTLGIASIYQGDKI